jgi:glycosyltransferase involved in cell wall biosynthesis
VGDAGIPFEEALDDLKDKIELALAMREEERSELRRRALERVRRHYCWDAVASEYESLFKSIMPKSIMK